MVKQRMELSSEWTLKWSGGEGAPGSVKGIEFPATVPGGVHVDLLAAGVIPDPFLDQNEALVAWVAEQDWTYTCRFDATPGGARTDLAFDGLDTLADLTLNGVRVGSTANMHRRYRFDVSDFVKDEANVLEIRFRSATLEGKRLDNELGYWPSAYPNSRYNYVRKMASSWGWDWGPVLTTAGVWRSAAVETWGDARLAATHVSPQITTGDEGSIDLGLSIETLAAIEEGGGLGVEIRVITPDGSMIHSGSFAVDVADVDLSFGIGPVQRWCPIGQGRQPLYSIVVELVRGTTVLDRWTKSIGFRSVELRLDPDPDPSAGTSFTFVVNGEPLFIRGVNWIPDDPLISRVDRSRYREQLELMAATNVNMARIWGGGIYEDDAFYEICDELGILVWQDFLFACAAYPEELLAEEVEAEARDNIERLMSHPSLVVWNGNNENQWGHADWGWDDHLGDGWSWGEGFYSGLLPKLVGELDPARPYSDGSPFSFRPGTHPNDDDHGSKHVWTVWNDIGYAHYRDHAPRFVSEFGWQAPATMHTIKRAIADDPLTPGSPGMAAHQKADDGDRKLRDGLAPNFPVPETIDEFVWATQLNQARAIRLGVEHFRSLRGRCMGTIWWQFNDCWPVTSWAVVDGDRRLKPAWYALRASYADRLVTIQPRDEGLAAVFINDGAEAWTGQAVIRRLTFDGSTLTTHEFEVSLVGGSSIEVSLPHDIANPGDPRSELLVVEIAAADPAFWFYEPDVVLDYEAPRLSVQMSRATPAETGFVTTLLVSADHLVRDLALINDLPSDAVVDNQLQTILPGRTARFAIRHAAANALDDINPNSFRSAASAAISGPQRGSDGLDPC